MVRFCCSSDNRLQAAGLQCNPVAGLLGSGQERENMAIMVKDAATAAQKFVTRGQAAAADYAKGVQGAGDTWQQHSAAAGDTFAAGVQDAITRGAFAKGITKAGSGKYTTNASGKGAQRYPQGVAQAGPAWQNGTAPYLATLASITLPPRRPKGDPGNMARVQAVTDALRKKKLAG